MTSHVMSSVNIQINPVISYSQMTSCNRISTTNMNFADANPHLNNIFTAAVVDAPRADKLDLSESTQGTLCNILPVQNATKKRAKTSQDFNATENEPFLHEDDRKRRRRAANRRAAKKCRQKKRDEQVRQETSYQNALKQNRELRQNLAKLEIELEKLRHLLAVHVASSNGHCPLAAISPHVVFSSAPPATDFVLGTATPAFSFYSDEQLPSQQISATVAQQFPTPSPSSSSLQGATPQPVIIEDSSQQYFGSTQDLPADRYTLPTEPTFVVNNNVCLPFGHVHDSNHLNGYPPAPPRFAWLASNPYLSENALLPPANRYNPSLCVTGENLISNNYYDDHTVL